MIHLKNSRLNTPFSKRRKLGRHINKVHENEASWASRDALSSKLYVMSNKR